MITLPSERDQKKVEAAISAQAQTGRRYRAGLNFTLGDENFTTDIKEAEWGQSETPITLVATLKGPIPRPLQTAKTRLLVEIDGVVIPQLHGEKTTTRPGSDQWTVDVLSSSPGALLGAADAVTMNAYQEYPEWPPDKIVWDIARRLPYDLNRVDVAVIHDVLVNFAATGTDPGFLPEEKTGDVLAKLESHQSVGYRFRDTAYKGLVAELPEPLGRSAYDQIPSRTYHARRLPDWSTARPSPPENLWHTVRVYCTDEKGRLDYEVFEEIPYTGEFEAPHEGRILHIPFNDYSPAGEANGRAHAARIALLEARRTCMGQMLLPGFDPLYELGDRYRVAEDVKDRWGHTEILWAMTAEQYRHGFNAQLGQTSGGGGAGILNTMLSYSATVLEENKVKPPYLIVPGVSPGHLDKYPEPDYGVDGDDIFFSQGIEWVTIDPVTEDLIIHQDEASSIDPATEDIVISQ